MSTFLQICQGVSRECRIAGGDTVPASVSGQTGVLDQIVNHVIQSWNKVQMKHPNWRWMRVGFTLTTSSGDDSYAYGDCTDDITAGAITRFSQWLLHDPDDYPKIYLSSSGSDAEGWLTYLDWNHFKRIYRIGAQTNGYPAFITVDPQNNIVLGPKPDDTYVISGDYQRGPQVLAADDDLPDMPSMFHDLILWEAVKRNATLNNKPEVLAQAKMAAAQLWQDLELNQLPPIQIAGPMA
jgi:hypothetical protein